MMCFLSSDVYYLLPTIYNIVLYVVFYYLHNSSSRQQGWRYYLFSRCQSLFGLSYRKIVSDEKEEEGNPAKSL